MGRTGILWALTLCILVGWGGFSHGEGLSGGGETGDLARAVDQLTDILDIRPLQPVEGPGNGVVFSILAAVVVLAAAVSYAAWRRWKHRGGDGEPAAFREPVHSRALRLLDDLGPAEKNDAKRFYFRLSAIFREYVQGRFGIDAPEMTSEELLPRMGRLDLPGELAEGVRDFARVSDRVKFSDWTVAGERLGKDLDFMRAFVTRTAAADEADDAVVAAEWKDDPPSVPPRLPPPPE